MKNTEEKIELCLIFFLSRKVTVELLWDRAIQLALPAKREWHDARDAIGAAWEGNNRVTFLGWRARSAAS